MIETLAPSDSTFRCVQVRDFGRRGVNDNRFGGNDFWAAMNA
jgi:hypothetical protein